ncbi:glycosyltransferase [Legionella hackeliae]|uniref:Glycosyl transferase family 1 domain-containing protein n=1 Tax=Legionella hackeliae TaxID=449 RepID=A0A0A8UMY6_LEGHA|nr:glycosyltransferase [Legionella hackeliae]KTD08807.1 glycosyltransferase, lipopolysaccharide biosynthesis protein [Legionella hackeliae]CEK10235.1 protein of unknown function [Legionella hackeliae]STX46964.1 glycosyltransferase, lipopolysaccharide biosynthesis protein [Legionella hackeliae]
MKILLNCSTLMKGGSLQVASAMFRDAIEDREFDWFFALTSSIFSKFQDLLESKLNAKRVILLDKSPAKDRHSRKRLQEFVSREQFNAVFTLFGPAYVNFSVPHLCGIADGWVTHATNAAYRSLPNLKERIRTYLLCQYKLHWYQRADRWCVEAAVARDGFLSKTKANPKAVAVIPNAVNQLIQEYATVKIERKIEDTIHIFCLGADYWHKNYQIIPQVLVALKKKIEKKAIFVVTLPEDSTIYNLLNNQAKILGVQENILNLGPISLPQVIESYKKFHILFFPSLLETFSITPLEAFYMNMPMVLSNLPANRQIVGEYAHYIDSCNSQEVANKLLELITNYDHEVGKLSNLKDNKYIQNICNAANRFDNYKKLLRDMIQTF